MELTTTQAQEIRDVFAPNSYLFETHTLDEIVEDAAQHASLSALFDFYLRQERLMVDDSVAATDDFKGQMSDIERRVSAYLHPREVGCETTDGLLIVHAESETCEVCSPANVEGEVPKIPEAPKHKHFFAPGYETCQCGAQRCSHRENDAQCKGVCTRESSFCRKHNKSADASAESKRGFWTAARILEILTDSDKTTTLETGKVVKNSFVIYRFLQRMLERQDADEQASLSTTKTNGIGFTGGDARLLTDMAQSSKRFNDEYVKKYGRMNVQGLTDRQAKYAASRLKKYVKTQLVEIANEATAEAMPEAAYSQAAVEQAIGRMHRSGVTPEVVTLDGDALVDALAAKVALSSPQQLEMHNVERKVAEMQRLDPKRYYDPFDEGERISEEAAREFWTKRFRSQP